MIIKNKKIKKNRIVIITIFGLVVLAAAIAFFYIRGGLTNNEPTKSTEKTSTIKTDDGNSVLPQKTTDNYNSLITEKKADTSTPATAPEKPYISRAEQVSSGDIKVVVTFRKESLGYCELQLSKQDFQTISRDTIITLGTSYYTCSFTLSQSDITSSGQWNLVILHHVGSSYTSSDIELIEVR